MTGLTVRSMDQLFGDSNRHVAECALRGRDDQYECCAGNPGGDSADYTKMVADVRSERAQSRGRFQAKARLR